MGFLCEDLHCTRPVQLCLQCRAAAAASSSEVDPGFTGPGAPAGQPTTAASSSSIFLTMCVDVDGGAGKWCGKARIVPATIRRRAERGVKLFFIGAAFALLLYLLQRQRRVVLLGEFLQSAWWLLLVCGLAAAFVGLLYPCIDVMLGEQHRYKREWSSVMRCVAVFVGINHASAKINFDSNLQLSVTLASLSVALWWLFDRSRSGFGLGLAVALLATAVIQILVTCGVFWYSEPDFLYMRSWVPCVFFSGGVTVGTIGRQMAVADEELTASCRESIKTHAE